MNTRRKLVIALGVSALTAPLTPIAQQPAKFRRLGLLSSFSSSEAAPWHEAFLRGLRDLGWDAGKNINIEYRYAEGRSDRLPDLAADLVRLKVDVIVASITPDVLAAKKATHTIPIVMASGDPIAVGLVKSLAQPGGNVTGLSTMSFELGGKRLALLKEILPKLSSAAVLWNPDDQISSLQWKEIQLPAQKLGIQLHSLEVRGSNGIDRAFDHAKKVHASALVIVPNSVFMINLKRIAALAAKNGLPSVFHLREFVIAGGLLAYGPDRAAMFRRAATYVDKIFKGAKPADLPVEQPTKFELFINGKTAKKLGLTIPQSLLISADKVIE